MSRISSVSLQHLKVDLRFLLILIRHKIIKRAPMAIVLFSVHDSRSSVAQSVKHL